MSRQYNNEARILKRLKELEPRAWVTYFPQGGFYSCSYWDKDDKYCSFPENLDSSCKQTAMLNAIKYLEKRNAEAVE